MGGLCTGRRSDARLATFLVVRRPSIVVSDDGKPARAALGTLLTVEEVSLALRASQELRSRSHEFRVLGFWDSARKKFAHDKVFRKRCSPLRSLTRRVITHGFAVERRRVCASRAQRVPARTSPRTSASSTGALRAGRDADEATTPEN